MTADASRHAYVDLLKRAVSNYLYLGGEQPFGAYAATSHYDTAAATWRIDAASRPLSLSTKAQLDLAERCLLQVVAEGVPGDVIEAGVWRGGMIALLRGLFAAHDISHRRVYAADSFAGIPLNTRFKHDPVDRWPDRWAAGLAEVKANLARFGLLD